MKKALTVAAVLAISAAVIAQTTRPVTTKPATTTQATQATQATQGGKIVNTRCPILGTPMDPDKTPDSMTRMFKGQKVGLCCTGCVTAWDKLSDKERQAKLDAAMKPDAAKPRAGGDDYDGGREPSHGAPK
jgi:hypothetical protein